MSNTISEEVRNQFSAAWCNPMLKQVMNYLETHRDEIFDRFEVENRYSLKRVDIKQSELLDFDVVVTLHRDQASSFGLGFGFFKAKR